MDGNIRNPGVSRKDTVKFSAIFLGLTIVFFLLLGRYQDFIILFYVRPLSYAGAFLLHIFGIQSKVVLDLQAGICVLLLGQVTYAITQGCTGLHTYTLFVSGVFSYPTAAKKKLIGLIIGLPAFFVFGTLRIVIMGVVAITQPASVEVFHIYIMAIVNTGFAMFVWVYWFSNVVKNEKLSPISG